MPSEWNWVKSSFCGDGNCIEVSPGKDLAFIKSAVKVQGNSQCLVVTKDELSLFIKGVKNGDFDAFE